MDDSCITANEVLDQSFTIDGHRHGLANLELGCGFEVAFACCIEAHVSSPHCASLQGAKAWHATDLVNVV